jgi:hypothetical protein
MALPSYLEDSGKHLATQMKATYGTPLQTGAFTPQIAGQDPMQTSAIAMAKAGIDSYKPFLTQAQTAMGQAGTAAGGLGALTGPMTQAQQTAYMSPYQSQVIDETLRQYDLSRTQGQQSIKDAAVGSGGFGGGREGAMLGQYNADTLANRAGIRSGLLQQGYMDAQGRRAQDFAGQQAIQGAFTGLAGQQMGLSNFQRAGMGQDIAAMGQMGASQQAFEQAKLNRDAQAAQTQAYEPYGRLSQYASGITGLAGGMAGPQFAEQPRPDPWGSALGTAMGLGGLYGKIFNPTPWS